MATWLSFAVMTLLTMGSVITASSIDGPVRAGSVPVIQPAIPSMAPELHVRQAFSRDDLPRVSIEQSTEPAGSGADRDISPNPDLPPLDELPGSSDFNDRPHDDLPALQLSPTKHAQKAYSVPVRIIIPSISVDAAVVPVGINQQGQMNTPEKYDDVGWYQFGAIPGALGSAVLAGHVDSFTGPAVFFKLKEIQPGDLVAISGGDQTILTFIVFETARYRADDAPVDRIFRVGGEPELVLITCGGPYDRESATYQERQVVYLRPVPQEANPPAP